MSEETIHCPSCNRRLVAEEEVPVHEFQKADRQAIRARVVFLNKAQGTVKAKCRGCGSLVDLPFRVSGKDDL